MHTFCPCGSFLAPRLPLTTLLALSAGVAMARARSQLYLLRWLRLLFGREFHLEDASVVWDALFAYGLGKDGEETLLTLVDDFAVAMLMYVREDILRMECHDAMKRLLKFPPVCDVHFLVQRALQLRKSYQQRSAAQSASPSPRAAPVSPVASIGGDGTRADWAQPVATSSGQLLSGSWKPESHLPHLLPELADKGAQDHGPRDQLLRPRSLPTWPPPVVSQGVNKIEEDLQPAQPQVGGLDESDGASRKPVSQETNPVAQRIARSIDTLNAMLRPAESESEQPSLSFPIGGSSHSAMLAALDDLDALRRELAGAD